MSETSTTSSAPAPASTRRARGVDRVIDLCTQLHRHKAPMTPRELVEATGAPRSSVYELVSILSEAGWLEVDRDGRIFFGRAMHLFGLDYAHHNDLISRARGVLRQLAAEFNETSQFCMLEGNKYTVVLDDNGTRPFRISADTGVRIPIPWTASGRVLLGDMSSEAICEFIPAEDFILPDGREIARQDFFAEIDRAREQGHAITEGLADSFACCLAVPVLDQNGHAHATLCFTIGRDATPARRDELLDALKQAARTLYGH
ncbi:IclR family transcriptional regulator [Kushneria sp. TE3]|uniref:IclR family transcriptional regulator n=1 Tax=Kushneria sp. TE3 TaxID=3449832 RepID=UPI003F685852